MGEKHNVLKNVCAFGSLKVNLHSMKLERAQHLSVNVMAVPTQLVFAYVTEMCACVHNARALRWQKKKLAKMKNQL